MLFETNKHKSYVSMVCFNFCKYNIRIFKPESATLFTVLLMNKKRYV